MVQHLNVPQVSNRVPTLRRYERPFLHAPYPHDPASSLAHTVTGDYASPATWGEIYRNKESIDWCTENFPWFEDRIKCIRKMHGQGPILG